MFNVFSRSFVSRRTVSLPPSPLSAGKRGSPAANAVAKGSGEPAVKGVAPRRVLIVGAGTVGQALALHMEKDEKYEVVGFLDDDVSPFGSKEGTILGSTAQAALMVERYAIDEVVVAYAPTWQQELMEHITLNGLPVQVRVVPSYYETMLSGPHMESMGDVALLSLMSAEKRASEVAKRGFDVAIALCCLVLLSPLAVFTSLLVAVTSSGPVLFTQERVGRYGKPFTLLKFRTMRRDAETMTGPVLSAGRDDARLTPIGRWLRLVRLDEVPQLINVLKGEMSLVGPRPERPHFVDQFAARNPLYARRHAVRPGITGLAQVHGGYHTDARDKLRFDLFYVSHYGVLLDVSIMARTILNILIRPDGC